MRFKPKQKWVIRLMSEAAVPCYTLYICALHKETSSKSQKTS